MFKKIHSFIVHSGSAKMVSHSLISFHTPWVFRQWFTALLLGALFLIGYPVNGRADSSTLSLYDSITFDHKLSRLMADKQPTITVTAIAPFTVNSIPERIDKWLSAVSEHDGEVEVMPDPDFPPTRDFGIIVDLINKIFDFAKELFIYKYAEDYNVVVYYKPESGDVTRFVFTLKEGVE
jgi:hypothetical protein